ncbi:MAG: phosphoglycolate phosphatase [Sphingomonadaceae bacterium]|nr:phosphoglycolate phosphatase [Sphingomonadaceae bacterium]
MTLPATIVFDLDGTLVDTGPDLTTALNHALVTLGREPVPEADVRDMVGSGALKLIERGLARTGGEARELTAAMMPLFLEYYAAHIADLSRPYPGVAAALDALLAAECRLAICTNKNERLARQLIEALGWAHRFSAILGGDSLPVRKPDPEHLLATIRAAGGEAHSAAFVGDTHFDTQAGHAAGVPTVAVRFGFSAESVDDLGADALIAHYDELIPALHALMEARAVA